VNAGTNSPRITDEAQVTMKTANQQWRCDHPPKAVRFSIAFSTTLSANFEIVVIFWRS
jgi:hypothetical protein